MGKDASKPCKGNSHRLDAITCSNPDCGESKRICRNKGCGWPSIKNMERFLCKLCWVAEKNDLDFTEEQKRDMLDRGKLALKASVSFDKKNNRFNYDEKTFFEIVEIEDSDREQVKNNFLKAQ